MKIKVEWEMTTRGESHIEVDEDEVRAWLDDPVTGGQRAGAVGDITEQDCYDFLEAGDDDVWIDFIDIERDATEFPWNPIELERLIPSTPQPLVEVLKDIDIEVDEEPSHGYWEAGDHG